MELPSGIFRTPTDATRLPRVTPAMLVDELEFSGFDVHHAAFPPRRAFRWLKPSPPNSGASDDGLTAAATLFVSQEADLPDLLKDNPAAYVLAYRPKGGIPKDLGPLGNRCMIVGGANYPDLCMHVLAFFSRVLVWERDLEQVALQRAGIGKLLDVGARMMGNFIFVSDSNLNVVASTSAVEPPDETHRKIMEMGRLALDDLTEKRFRLPEGEFYARAAATPSEGSRLSAPIHVNGSYQGSISMSCSARPDSQGLRDLFATMLKYARPLCIDMWKAQAELSFPSAVFLVRLLERREIDDAAFREQAAELGLAGEKHFKLIVMEQDPDIDPARAREIARMAVAMNQGKSYCFPYRNHVIVLCYAEPADDALSHRQTEAEFAASIYSPYGIIGGTSSKFFDLHDIDLAYRQACIALGFHGTVASERFDADSERTGVVLFEDALMYYLVDPSGKDGRFLDFIFEPSIARTLYEEDAANGTDTFAMLWYYLAYERNATDVATKLHVHRNTVLYHIEKIQKRFDFDLSRKTARDWLLLGYKHLFLSVSHESLGAILKDSRSGPYEIIS